MKKIIVFTIIAGITLAGFFCRKKKKSPEENAPFDKAGMLANYADNLILPAYHKFNASLDSLIDAAQQFTANPQISSLQNLRTKFNSAWMRYQKISPFEFGPAESVVVQMNFNVFPTDTTQIKSNIQSGNYNLDAASNLDAKGFPALDYLLYGYNKSDQDIVNEFLSQSNRKAYIMDVLFNMKSKITQVIQGWNNGYIQTFKNSLSTDIGSSIGALVNRLNFELDYLKNAKIGIPLGKKTLGYPVPGAVEGFYKKQSVAMAYETLLVIEDMFLGRGLNGVNGLGFDDYLNHLKAQHTNGPLADAINNQFSVAKNKLNQLTDPLSVQVVNNPNPVNDAWTELVKLLVLLKTDMPSRLGVQITYQDSDGD
ncbi:MAG: imelysin family protein [Bacteroidia bacterium]|nr:imelysin family protein [Bacteroidia bacterium]